MTLRLRCDNLAQPEQNNRAVKKVSLDMWVFVLILPYAKQGGSIMSVKTLIVAAALAVAPTFALARGGCGSMQQTAAACGDGQVWDESAQSCIIPPSS